MTQAKPFYRHIGGLHFLALGRFRVSYCRTKATSFAAAHETIPQPVIPAILAAAVIFGSAFLPQGAASPTPVDFHALSSPEQCFNDFLLSPLEEVESCLEARGVHGYKVPVVACETDAECVEADIAALRSWQRGQ